MPWIKIGRDTFDLDDVVHVRESTIDDGRLGVTITLVCGEKFDMDGDDAESFSMAFARHVAAKEVGPPGAPNKGPPRRVRGSILVMPDEPADPDPPQDYLRSPLAFPSPHERPTEE